MFFFFWPQDMREHSSQMRDGTSTPCIGRWCLNYWTARDVPDVIFKSQSYSSILFLKKNYLFIWLHWVFLSAQGLSLVVVSGGCSVLEVASLVAEHMLESVGSIIVMHGLGCHQACGIFPDKGLSLCRLHWQADSQPLDYQESPTESSSSSATSTRSCLLRWSCPLKSTEVSLSYGLTV